MSDEVTPLLAGADEPADGEKKLRLGGMALRNGLLVHGPTHWAAAVRTTEGAIKVASGRKPKFSGGPVGKVAGLRGVLKLGEALAVIPITKRGLPEARLPMQDARTLAAITGASVAARLLKRRKSRGIGNEGLVAGLGLAPALFALSGGDLAAYHGVEHKAIAGYEQGTDAVDARKEHERCGSNLVAPMLATAVAGNVAVRRAGLSGPAADLAVVLASMGAAVEVFAWSERNADSSLAQALKRPGYEIQRLIGTREPTEEQLEVGRAALAEILRVEGAEKAPPPVSDPV